MLLVDDHAVVRRGLRGFLELLDDIEVVGEAEDGRAGVEAVERTRPDVVLMDLVMPELDGIGAIAAIKAAHPETEIVALTSFIEEDKVTAALEAGASGYLLKDAEADDVAAAIRAAYAGEVHLDPAVARLLAQRMRARQGARAGRAADRPRARGPRAGRQGAWPTRRSPTSWASPSGRPGRTSATSWASSVSPAAPRPRSGPSTTGWSRPTDEPGAPTALEPGRPPACATPRVYSTLPPNPPTRGSMRVRKAVFPAAGWGTRFLPATKAQPKEMLPLVDKPIIQYAVEEAVAAGIEQVIIVTSSQKRAIEDHFDLYYELEHLLEERGDIEMLRRVRHISDLAQIAYVRQKEQLGLGHAVLMAKELVGHEPFAVILSDDVVVGERPVHRPAHPRLPPDPRLGRGGQEVPRRGDRPLRRHRRRRRRPSRSTTVACIGSTGVVEKPAPGRRAVEPRHHRALRADAQDLRQARADAARRRRRDPADRRDRGPDGGAARLRLRVRGRPATTPARRWAG